MPGNNHPEPASSSRTLNKDNRGTRSDETGAKEKILDTDRKKLDEIIRQENR